MATNKLVTIRLRFSKDAVSFYRASIVDWSSFWSGSSKSIHRQVFFRPLAFNAACLWVQQWMKSVTMSNFSASAGFFSLIRNSAIRFADLDPADLEPAFVCGVSVSLFVFFLFSLFQDASFTNFYFLLCSHPLALSSLLFSLSYHTLVSSSSLLLLRLNIISFTLLQLLFGSESSVAQDYYPYLFL